jgi:hypothetical protein
MFLIMLLDTALRARLLVHLVDGDLAGGAEEGGDSCGRCFHGMMDLVQSMFVIGLVLEASD